MSQPILQHIVLPIVLMAAKIVVFAAPVVIVPSLAFWVFDKTQRGKMYRVR